MASSVTSNSLVDLPITPVAGVHTTSLQNNALAQSVNTTITQLVTKTNSTSASLGVQTSVSSPAFSHVYQNTNTFPILVTVCAHQISSTGGTMTVLMDTTSSPSTFFAADSAPAVPTTAYITVTFGVPPSYYYKMTTDHLIINTITIMNLG